MNLSLCLVSLAVLSAPQSSVDLKLKLREDETVRFRTVLSVATYSQEKIDERVASTLTAYTFGAETDGKIPVKAVIEDFEDMDPNNNAPGGNQALRGIVFAFSVDRKGKAGELKHTTSNAALEPYAVLFGKTIGGLNAAGLLGLNMPDKAVSIGATWSATLRASDFLAPAFGPAGDAFRAEGDIKVSYKLVDIINVNNRRHARIEATATGAPKLDITAPEFMVTGELKVTSSTSIVVDLDTGLVTRSKEDTSADLVIDGNSAAQIEISSLTYRA